MREIISLAEEACLEAFRVTRGDPNGLEQAGRVFLLAGIALKECAEHGHDSLFCVSAFAQMKRKLRVDGTVT